MTLRFIVGGILRELIELAERDADAELVDALHDALDVASPAGRLQHGSGGGVDREDMHEGLAVPVRGVAGWERSGGAEQQVGAGRDRDRCSEGSLNVAGAYSVAAAGCSRSRWTTAPGSVRRQRPRWTRRSGSGSCSGRRSTRCGTSVPTITTTSTSDDGRAFGSATSTFSRRPIRCCAAR